MPKQITARVSVEFEVTDDLDEYEPDTAEYTDSQNHAVRQNVERMFTNHFEGPWGTARISRLDVDVQHEISEGVAA